ncbi:MAG: ATP-binding cassette domain-containing protein [bacterium]
MLIKLRDIHKDFNIEKGLFKQESGLVKALDGVSLSIEEFNSLGIVGESGCGKTTLAKIILKLIPATSGEVIFDEHRISNFRKDVQIIFQNPYNSLDPKMRVGEIISEPLLIHRIVPAGKRIERVRELLNMVGLDRSSLSKYPREFSGGERQRVCIARALASEPKLLVLDEPISSLDLTIQAKLLDLFAQLKESLKLTLIFISHNLAVIKHIADSVVVMRQGKIVEEGLKEQIFNNPQHFYTKLLLESAS